MKPESYAEAPEDIRPAVEHLIRQYGSDPALLAGAIVSATVNIIHQTKADEREACAKIADDFQYTQVAKRIRNRS